MNKGFTPFSFPNFPEGLLTTPILQGPGALSPEAEEASTALIAGNSGSEPKLGTWQTETPL